MNEVIIKILHISFVKQRQSFVLSFVDQSRREKADNFVNEKDRLLSLGGAYLLKKYLPEGEIKTLENGKPYLENGPFFNLYHSGDYVVLAVHPTREVGVDIETINKDKLNGIRYVLNEKENQVTEMATLFQMWSNKESLIKCISTGLKDIKKAPGLPLQGERVFEKEGYFTKSTVHDGYSLSVTLKGKEPFVIRLENIENSEE